MSLTCGKTDKQQRANDFCVFACHISTLLLLVYKPAGLPVAGPCHVYRGLDLVCLEWVIQQLLGAAPGCTGPCQDAHQRKLPFPVCL